MNLNYCIYLKKEGVMCYHVNISYLDKFAFGR